MKRHWRLLVLLYITMVFGCTLLLHGHSMQEWVTLLVPSGRLQTWLLTGVNNCHPVIFSHLLDVGDTIVNCVLFFPFGLIMFAALHHIFPDRIQILLLLSIGISLLLSFGIETFQMLVPNRVPELSDVIANVGGMVLGCYWPYFWRCLTGRRSI